MRATTITFAISLIFFLSSCDKASEFLEKPPEAALTGYLDATIGGNWSAAYGHISNQDKAVKSLSEYKAEAAEVNELTAVIANKTSYKVISVEKSGDTATARVEISVPDLSGLFADLMKSAFSSAFGKDGATDNMEAKLKEKAESGDFPLRTEQQEFTILRETDGWRIFLDWETKKKVSSLVAEAEKLQKQKNFELQKRNMMKY